MRDFLLFFFFFFNDTATTEIYTLSLHDALPILNAIPWGSVYLDGRPVGNTPQIDLQVAAGPHRLRVERDGYRPRSEEHTSELQSRLHLVCRLLLEKKTNTRISIYMSDNKTTLYC